VGVVEVVVWVVVVGEVAAVEVDLTGTVWLELSLLSSPITMIRPTTSPITRAMRIPIVQRARVFTGAMLTEAVAGNQALRSFR
jgi:hypothetical protein